MNQKSSKSKAIRCLMVAAVLLFLWLCSFCLGSVSLTPGQIWEALRGTDGSARIILLRLRLPRVCAAALAGTALASAGLLLQTVTDNDLCAPNIIGVNAGAGLGVMLCLCFFPLGWRFLPFAAFLGALGTTGLVLFAASASAGGRGGFGERKSTLVLAGVAVSSLGSAGISFLSLRYPDALPSYTGFSVGGFSGVGMDRIALPSVIIGCCLLFALFLAPKLSLLRLGDETAGSLGVSVRSLQAAAIVLASALCASAVSFAGLLGFVGLVAPHITRRIARGFSLRGQMGMASLIGASLTVLSDLVGRTLFAPGELPAGVILAVIGAPFFLWLLIRRR